MDTYFSKFQIINYDGHPVRNITQRAVVLNSVYSNPLLYYPYDVRQYERPDNISDRYYNDEYMSWILLLTNKVIDPYYDWYMDQETFEQFLIKKYGSLYSATNKVKYYRNNWYDYLDPITPQQYLALDDTLFKFYEPVLEDGEVPVSPKSYRRKRIDWKLQTNYVVKYSVANGSSFAADELVDVTVNGSVGSGRGQVTFANSSVVQLHHLSGAFTANTITGNTYIKGLESKSNTAVTAISVIANNVPLTETLYWSPVTYLDYESDLNERNKSIQVLNAAYSKQISNQLKKLLK